MKIYSNSKGSSLTFTALSYILALFVLMPLCGCFTGIEGTKKITLPSGMDEVAPLTPEQSFIAQAVQDSVKDWTPGKRVSVLDSRINSLIVPVNGFSSASLSRGDTLYYVSSEWRRLPDNSTEALLKFSNGQGNEFLLPTGRKSQKDLDVLTAGGMDMLLDMDFIKALDGLLRGKELWTLSSLWYDTGGTRIDGKKYYPVKIREVRPGSVGLPLMVVAEADGREMALFLNQGERGTDTRSFSRIFSLSDPRDRYPGISTENWKLIQLGKVAKGMTKLECRLSLGNPQDLDKGHDYNRIYEIWVYSDGKSLWFMDGLLDKFRE